MYEKFKKLLDSRGITPYRVSKETGLSTATLSDWKNGKSVPKRDKIEKICEYFNVSPSYFYEDADSDTNDKYYLNSETAEMAQEIVLNYLKSPNSAKFPWNTDEIGFSKNGNIVSVQGYVDAQNSFGAEIRSQWTVQYEITDFDNLLCNPLYVNIDGTEVGTYTNLE